MRKPKEVAPQRLRGPEGARILARRRAPPAPLPPKWARRGPGGGAPGAGPGAWRAGVGAGGRLRGPEAAAGRAGSSARLRASARLARGSSALLLWSAARHRTLVRPRSRHSPQVTNSSIPSTPPRTRSTDRRRLVRMGRMRGRETALSQSPAVAGWMGFVREQEAESGLEAADE